MPIKSIRSSAKGNDKMSAFDNIYAPDIGEFSDVEITDIQTLRQDLPISCGSRKNEAQCKWQLIGRFQQLIESTTTAALCRKRKLIWEFWTSANEKADLQISPLKSGNVPWANVNGQSLT